MDNELLVKSIKNICQINNISVSQLENTLRFSPSLISRWNKTSPSLDKIVDIADYFHVSLDEVVGRTNNNTNDDFLKVLYNKTINKEIQWNIFDQSKNESGLKKYHKNFEYGTFLSQEDYEEFCNTHKQISYYFEYCHGYISIYVLYKYYNIATPEEIRLFIQPDIQAELIPQSYDTNELLPLWIKILTSLENNAPDEIRAEDLKLQFIKNG